MPGLNGFEVCKKIREKSRLQDLPVIFLTANAEPEHIIEGFSSGGQDYVTKPFHAGELLSRIGTHLELRENRKQLKQMNVILEEKVKERTRELLEANKNLEAAYRQLEQLDEAKADFLHLISHEINTPLNGIIGFAEILKEQLDSTEYFDHIKYLSHSAYRLNEFAKSSLIITEMRTSPENVKKKNVVDFKELIQKEIAKQEDSILQKRIQINFHCIANRSKILGNERLIKICMMHVLKNAIQYTPEGQIVTVNCYNDNTNLIVSFEDSGPGFSENALRNLFKPFSPGEKHVDKNKGLGLSLVKMIVDFHHAEISVSNQRSKGAKVTLIFNQLNKD
jgi:two-component system sensor histidine kinase/response regulator